MATCIVDEFGELYKGYDQGLYTDAEIISKSLGLLGEGDEILWAAFPAHIKDEIRKFLAEFSEGDEIVSFGSEDVESLKSRLVALKKWLSSQT